jgi:hypothetical protein
VGEGVNLSSQSQSQTSGRDQITHAASQGLGYKGPVTLPIESDDSMTGVLSRPSVAQQGMTIIGPPLAKPYSIGHQCLPMIGLNATQQRQEQGMPMSSDSLHPYQNLPPGDLLTRKATQDPQVLINPNTSYLDSRFQIPDSRFQVPSSQNPIAMLQQTGNITYPTQNISQSNAQIYAQQQMPTGAKVKANQSIPLGLDGPYAHQSLQPIRPMSNPMYDDVPR